ncbi:ubiquitin thioesterase OTU1-like protein [Radiomyces spectabilis]|uniref:ubiquitin thioesterase OTU1-like protein n=1 Tax=Radiomyces spectabilis TaxID=64574 RepID=UPI00221F2670|nr:ubiquitin thioesterase OTU1-like protein [Radiomyces spectabilis]KAI8379125.1 ubiquitin thioesterase OTU1-like protein [Radiomyces spectabilis]
MRVRIRHPQGSITLTNLQAEYTIAQLREAIAQAIHITTPQSIRVSGGYPPKGFTDDSATLQACGLRDGDTLNVTLTETTNVPSPAPVAQTTTTTTTLPFDPQTMEAVQMRGGILRVRHDIQVANELRKVIAACIGENPAIYSDVMLGQERGKYMEWIQKSSAWGGAIELSIFSQHFGIEIDSIDVQTGRIDKFGEGAYAERVLILYSGIHYDAVGLAPTIDSPPDFDQTRFPVGDDALLPAAQKLAEILRKKHKYTDVATFTLKCQQCQKGLKGEKDAQAHASATGHTHFVEYE